ncbi:MAG: ABC transporter permease [Armatimonadetes bacterium]|nr:MAG: ABC transporter permease [Armatimonadota bacterium]
MRRRDQIAIVATREIVERSRSTVFRVMLVAMALLVGGGIIALSFINPSSQPIHIGLAGVVVPGLEGDIETVAGTIEQPVTVTAYPSTQEADTALEDGDIDVLLVDSSTVVTTSGASLDETIILSTAVNVAGRRVAGQELGLSDSEIAAIVQPITLTYEETDDANDADEIRAAVAFMGAILLFVTIMVFGQFVAYGIVEEKQNRVVEVVLSRIDSTSLLVGKVLGIGALGLLQVGAVVLAAAGALLYIGSDALEGIDLSAVGIPGIVSLVFWFVLGYLMFSFIYAAAGATVSRLEDLQSVAFVPMLLLMPAYLVVSFSLGEVNAWTRVASFVPLWTPIVMPVRIAQGDAAWWEVALSIVLILAFLWLVVRVAARIYRGAALHTGGRVKIREALRGSGV